MFEILSPKSSASLSSYGAKIVDNLYTRGCGFYNFPNFLRVVLSELTMMSNVRIIQYSLNLLNLWSHIILRKLLILLKRKQILNT